MSGASTRPARIRALMMDGTEHGVDAYPGSDAALAMGCRCDPLANNAGRWCPYGTDGWVIADGCPVHAPRAA